MASQTTYLDFIDAVKSYYGSGSDQFAEIAKYGLKADNAVNILKQIPDVEIIKNRNGTVAGITYKGFTSYGGYSGQDAQKVNQILQQIDSNYVVGSHNVKNSFNLKVPSNTKVNASTGELEMTSEIGTKVSTGQKVIGALGTIGQAVFAVTTGVTLGKIIDSALYNANPDFWNAHDMETLDPSTWASITNGGTIGENAFNLLMGIDPETNETTAYVDQNALAYMALYLQNKGVFDSTVKSEVSEEDINTFFPEINDYIESPLVSTFTTSGGIYGIQGEKNPAYIMHTDKPVYMYNLQERDELSPFSLNMVYNEDFKFSNNSFDDKPYDLSTPTNDSGIVYADNTHTYYSGGGISGSFFVSNLTLDVANIKVKGFNNDKQKKIAWLIANKTVTTITSLDGVSTQPDATTPDLSNVNSVNDVLNALKTQYPDLFNNAITNSVPQEDGSIKDYTYVPVTLPNTNNANDAEPTTGEQTQSKPKVDPQTSPDTLLDLITNLINNKLDTPNTPNKGEGSTPSMTTPTGSASALYKIYNPSQAELDSFGQWLWSSSFVDQLLKVFNNPMESIIGLHKVYAIPTIGGQTNIKVGYLDSGVSSNFVSNQYSKIDCGTVNLREYFGNVFDYSPYTHIQLYLPCIGFVNLNVGDVMRSQLNIVYTVDVLTGTCLAEVRVIRDGGGGVLYSYSGNCASQYPLSSGSYMGIVSSAIGIAGSVVGTVASGGSLAPLALGTIGGVMNAHTNVQHSGSLSGNSGVMGIKKPYLIITRPQTNMASNYEHYQGVPSNFYTSLSSCTGFTKVKNVDVRNINAESNELDKIKSLLMEGVII